MLNQNANEKKKKKAKTLGEMSISLTRIIFEAQESKCIY